MMKSKEVCVGCKYCVQKVQNDAFNGACDYCEITGHSRMLVEMANGGIKKDSCVCYEEGEYKHKCFNPYGKDVGGM